jgi:putative lipoprotein
VPTPPIAPDDVPPEGALRAYGWECSDGSTPLMHNLLRVRAIELDLPGGRQRLEQTVSASGVRYANADGSLVFWTKGTTARIERAGAAPVQCTERRAVSLCEDARLRGVVYRALGNEPGWTLEIGPGTTVDWVTNYGQERHRFDGAVEEAGGDATARTYTAGDAGQTLRVTVTTAPCTDDAGIAYDHTATIEFAGGTLRGCAVKLN